MILSILFMILVIVSASAVFCFIFFLFLPSLKTQSVNTSNPLISKEEFADDRELLVSVPENISKNDTDVEESKKSDVSQFLQLYGEIYNLNNKFSKISLNNKKVFQFWLKCYKMFYTKKEM